jgi:hypothetical protein
MKDLPVPKLLGHYILILSILCSGAILCFGGVYAWIMRDGLGPESYTSSGFTAYMKFAPCFLPFGIGSYIVLMLGALAALWSAKGRRY